MRHDTRINLKPVRSQFDQTRQIKDCLPFSLSAFPSLHRISWAEMLSEENRREGFEFANIMSEITVKSWIQS